MFQHGFFFLAWIVVIGHMTAAKVHGHKDYAISKRLLVSYEVLNTSTNKYHFFSYKHTNQGPKTL